MKRISQGDVDKEDESTANLIAAAKKSDDPKMVALAEKAAGGCTHSTQELIAMGNKQDESQAE